MKVSYATNLLQQLLTEFSVRKAAELLLKKLWDFVLGIESVRWVDLRHFQASEVANRLDLTYFGA